MSYLLPDNRRLSCPVFGARTPITGEFPTAFLPRPGADCPMLAATRLGWVAWAQVSIAGVDSVTPDAATVRQRRERPQLAPSNPVSGCHGLLDLG